MPAKKGIQKTKAEKKTTVAKQENGTVQITFTITWKDIEKQFDSIAIELSKTITVPGFRKGKAPLNKVLPLISRETLVEKTLQKMLPKLFSEAIKKHKINPATYPKFELLKAKEGEDWQIRATTCELPEIKLGNYKKKIKESLTTNSIWTPEKGDDKDKKPEEDSKAKKEQAALETLLKTIKFKVPELLVNQEVDSRIANLIQRIEKLNLNIDSYLSSIKKTPQSLREDYKVEAENTLKLEIILNKIAEKENIFPTKIEIDSFIKAAQGDPNFAKDISKEDQIRLVSSILTKRKVISMLSSL